MKGPWVFLAVTITIGLGLSLVTGGAQAEDAKKESPAQAGEQVGVEGTFVRIAANDEGWVVLGYRVANDSVGKKWMLLDVGMTVMAGTKPQTITRGQIKLVTPDHKVVSLPTQQEFEKDRGSLAALEERAKMMGDSINYFPAGASTPCRLAFFADAAQGPGMARDELELDHRRACVGRVYFEVPEGIQYGNYNFDVQFEKSTVRVPMEIMTEEQSKEFTKKWKEAKKKAKHEGH